MISKNQLKYVRQLEQKKYRNREQAFVAEGPKVVGDLLKCGFKPMMLFATQQQWEASRAIEVSEEELRKLSFLQHPQQVLAVFPIPLMPHRQPIKGQLYLCLDGIQDPGNLGTIIRIADWFGIDTVYCSVDTVDVWNPKVIQASMGSIARVRVEYTDLGLLIRECEMPVYGTLLDGEDIYAQQLSGEGMIVMGNEGNGISADIRPLITQKLLIPNFRTGNETAESLNVAIATAITCSEFKRRSS